MKYSFHPEAEQEFIEAIDYFEESGCLFNTLENNLWNANTNF